MRVLYKNGTAAPISHQTAGSFAVGESKTLYHFLADKQGLTLVTYETISPVKDLHHAAPGALAEPLTGLSAYRQVDVRNKSGDVIEVTFNGDTGDPLYLLDGEIRVFLQEEDKDITLESIALTGSGVAPVYITGWVR